MKKLAGFMIVTAAVVMLAGCGQSSSGSSAAGASSAGDAAKTGNGLRHVVLASNPFIGNGPSYVAMDKGFFKNHGIDVENVEFDDASENLSAVMAGKADIADATLDSALIAADQNRSSMISVIGIQDDSEGADGIVAKNGIGSIKDLKGKTVGVDVNQTSHLLLHQALMENGLKDSDVKLQDMTASDAGTSFISGALDAAVTWEPYLSNAANDGVGKMIYSSKDAPGLIMDVFCISKKANESSDNEWVSEYLQGLDDAIAYIEADSTKADAFKIIGDHLGVDADEAEKEWSTIKTYPVKDMCSTLASGGTAYKTVDSVNKFYTQTGTMSGNVEPDDVLNPKYAEKTLSAGK